MAGRIHLRIMPPLGQVQRLDLLGKILDLFLDFTDGLCCDRVERAADIGLAVLDNHRRPLDVWRFMSAKERFPAVSVCIGLIEFRYKVFDVLFDLTNCHAVLLNDLSPGIEFSI